MILNKCINCAYWLTCHRASEEISNCEYFRKSEIMEVNKNENND